MAADIQNELEGLCEALILADGEAPEALKQLRERIARVDTSQWPPPLRQRFETVLSLASRLEANDPETRRKAMADLDRELSVLQDEAAGTSAQALDLELIGEFVSSQQLSLHELEAELLAVERGSTEPLTAIRRRIHTLKGEAGAVGLDKIAEVYHAFEELLSADVVRHVSTLLQAHDWLAKAVAECTQGVPDAVEVLAALQAAKSASAAPQASPAPAAPQAAAPQAAAPKAAAPQAAAPQAAAPQAAAPQAAAPQAAAPQAAAPQAADPGGSVVRDADTLATFADFLTEADDGLARVDQLLVEAERDGADPKAVDTLFRIYHTIKGTSGFLECRDITELAHATETFLERIRSGFGELKGGSADLLFDSTEVMHRLLGQARTAVERSLPIVPGQGDTALLQRLRDAAAGSPPPPALMPEAKPGERLGEILQRPPLNVPAPAVQAALRVQRDTGRKLGEELVSMGAAAPKDVAHALRAQAGRSEARLQETVKLDVARVDQLVEIIGELVVVDSMVQNTPEIAALDSPRVRKALSQLHKITRDAQDVGMRMRMVPVRGVFQKMARMVRDVSRKNGKAVVVELSGEGTEMDRGMVEQIADPLVHMIRNAIDHGIESPADRKAAGKPETGMLHLSACCEGDHIAIELSDDGKGLDREAILRKAVSQGLVRADEDLPDSEVYRLIFLPGFSTAKQVTELSGRGVGMDVVKRNVEAMRGRVAIETVKGKGTTFRLLLPLTLAIIDGMLVRCGTERYIIPTLSASESIRPTRDMLVTLGQTGEGLNIRGKVLPLVRLSRLFEIADTLSDATQGLVMILEANGRKLGLLVDEVLSQQKVVIKSLGCALQNVDLVAGAAILFDGTVGLILNADQVVTAATDAKMLAARSVAGTPRPPSDSQIGDCNAQ